MFPAIRHNLSLAGNKCCAQALFPAKSKNNIFAGSTMKSLSNQQRLHQVNTELGIPDDRDRSFRRIVTEDSDLSWPPLPDRFCPV
jgi:hypothetical protein